MSQILKTFKKSDIKILYIFNVKFRCKTLSHFMRISTNLGAITFSSPYLLLLLLMGIRKLAVYSLINLFFGQIVVQTLKRLVDRERPFNVLDFAVTDKIPYSKYSFPSGHTNAAFCMAFPILTLGFPLPLCILAIFIATIVGLSRMYLGVHYPSDVIVGIFAAFLVNKFVYYFIDLNIATSYFSNILSKISL